jgi:hypothetical protein
MVLITGCSGALAAPLARHGVRHLLLCSRSGGAAMLQAELDARGATVEVRACDDLRSRAARGRAGGAAAACGVPPGRRHRDAVLGAQTPEHLALVLGPKLADVVHPHELTRSCDLAQFVLFSSISGLIGVDRACRRGRQCFCRGR